MQNAFASNDSMENSTRSKTMQTLQTRMSRSVLVNRIKFQLKDNLKESGMLNIFYLTTTRSLACSLAHSSCCLKKKKSRKISLLRAIKLLGLACRRQCPANLFFCLWNKYKKSFFLATTRMCLCCCFWNNETTNERKKDLCNRILWKSKSLKTGPKMEFDCFSREPKKQSYVVLNGY